MSLTARNRVSAVDVLQVDFEYSTISYYVERTKNDLGEPSRTLTQRSTNAKCSIDPLVRMPTYIEQSGVRQILEQGIVEGSSFYMVVLASTTIQTGDVITNFDGTTYDVLHVVNWYTHQEAFLRKLT